MAFPVGSKGIVPWMNGRTDAGLGNNLPASTVVSFPAGGNITIKWLEDGTYTNTEIAIFNHGRWGTDKFNYDHYPLVKAKDIAPVTTTYTVADRTALFALFPVYQDQTAKVTSDNSYWIYFGGSWIRLIQKVNSGTIVAYGVTATIYTITLPQSDLPKVGNIGIQPGGYYDLCWQNNGLHAYQYDATFNVLPSGYRIYDEIPDRTELNSRVAGEKALFEDEFITASQLEAGVGVSIKYRTINGSLIGYATEAEKGGNIVVESSGVIYTQAAKSNAAVYYDEQTAYIQFRDKSFIHPFPNDSKIPIEFDVYEENGVSVITGNALNNNLYIIKKDLLNVQSYPLGTIGDQTANFIQFADNADVTWTVSGSRLNIYTPEGLVEKKGITISPVITFPTGYSGWNVTDADTPVPTIGFVSDNDTVTFDGTNGVAIQVSTLSATDHKVEINRPLQIQEDNVNVGSSATTTVNFDSNGQTTTATPVNFVVSDINASTRRIRAYVPSVSAGGASNEVWVKHWWKNYNLGFDDPAFQTLRPYNHIQRIVSSGGFAFSGHGMRNAAFALIGNAETVIEHTGLIQPPQTPPNIIVPGNALYPQVDAVFEPIKVLKTGSYLVHTVIQGMSSPSRKCYDIQGIFDQQHELQLHYVVRRFNPSTGIENRYATYCLDHKKEYFRGRGRVESEVYYPSMFSTKWSLQGTAILGLQENDEIYGFVSAISYVAIAGQMDYIFQRDYTVQYITQHIEYVSEIPLTTNLMPHNNDTNFLEYFSFS